MITPLPANLLRIRRIALIVGAAALVASLIGWIFSPTAFLRAYLWSFLFALSLSLGSLGWVMMHHLVGGGWGRAIQRIAEAAAMNLPLLAILFIPVLFGLSHLYPWADHRWLARDPVLRHREIYLNGGAFFLRALMYLAIWIALALLLVHGSTRYDRTNDLWVAKWMRRVSAAGLVIYTYSMTLAGVDWIMSREPHYYSTDFGFILVVGQALSALAFSILVLTLLLNRSSLPFGEPLRDFATRGHFNDLGNLVLTCVILWAYVAFAQFLISWTGQIQPEIKWYYLRAKGLYGFFAVLIICFHFFIPFFLLLSKQLKRHPERLAWVCGALLSVHFLDVFWMVAPTNSTASESLNRFWLNVTCPVGVCGIWLAVFLWQLERRPILAVSEHEEPSSAMEEDSDPRTGPHGERHAHPA